MLTPSAEFAAQGDANAGMLDDHHLGSPPLPLLVDPAPEYRVFDAIAEDVEQEPLVLLAQAPGRADGEIAARLSGDGDVPTLHDHQQLVAIRHRVVDAEPFPTDSVALWRHRVLLVLGREGEATDVAANFVED